MSKQCSLMDPSKCQCCTCQGKQCSRNPTHGNLCTQHANMHTHVLPHSTQIVQKTTSQRPEKQRLETQRIEKQRLERQRLEVNNKRIYVIFDFDCTLTYAHSFYFLNDITQFLATKHWVKNHDKNAIRKLSTVVGRLIIIEQLDQLGETDKQLIIDVVFGGPARLQKTYDFLAQLKLHGCQLQISSRGHYTTIVQLLRCVGLDRFFEYHREKDYILYAIMQMDQNITTIIRLIILVGYMIENPAQRSITLMMIHPNIKN